MIGELFQYMGRPELYEPSAPFWSDGHISEYLLEAHLNAGWDAASRKHHFIERSARWIAEIAPPAQFRDILDLGCGPGLYAEWFCKLGYSVTGIDFSERSIDYASEHAAKKGFAIEYLCENYLEMDYSERFDVITVIYCDYGALPDADRGVLIDKAFCALRDNGKLIIDCFSHTHFEKEREETSFDFCDEGGFWKKSRYLALNMSLRYPDVTTLLRRHVILTENTVDCYNFHDRCFSREELGTEIMGAGFTTSEFYGDIAGRPFSKKSDVVCGVFTK